jgi:hypothetical protein
MPYYSARLLYYILVADGPPRRRQHCDETVVLFQAANYDRAFERALAIGRAAEADYENAKGQRARWVLVAVETLDEIGAEVDGAEVASRQHTRVTPRPVPANRQFHPEPSKPEQTAPAGLLSADRERSRALRGGA